MSDISPRGTHFNHAPNDADLFANWLGHAQGKPSDAPSVLPEPRPGRRQRRRRRRSRST